MKITKIRSRWPEKAGFCLTRAQGVPEHILLHFLTPVSLWFDGQTAQAEKGAFLLLTAGTPHGFTSQGPLLHNWMHLSGDAAPELAAFGLRPNTLYATADPAAISELFARMEAEFFACNPYGEAMLASLWSQVLIAVARGRAPQARGLSQSLAERLRDLRTQMLLKPEYGWTCAELARRACVSESRLFAAYRLAFGISPNRDLILIRLEKAKTHLSQGRGVSETAELTGYRDVCHFIRQFRALEGVTPKRFARDAGEPSLSVAAQRPAAQPGGDVSASPSPLLTPEPIHTPINTRR